MTDMPSDSESRSPKGESPSSTKAAPSSFSKEDISLPLPVESEEENPSVAPFSLSDQPSPNDKLGFRPYVQAIADFLMNQGTRPPLTLSVEGQWGSGKSSFMKQLQVEVENKGARTVWFNGWRYDKEDSMLAAFAVALTSELGRQQTFMERVGAYTKLQKKRFGWRSFAIDLLAKLVLVFFVVFLVYCLFRFSHIAVSKVFAKDAILPLCLGLGLPGTFLLGIATIRKLYRITGNPLKIDLKKFANNPRYEERVPTIDKLHEDFERIVKCYAHGKRLFVFIDDLDRCDVPKSAEMMQALNLLLSDSLEVIYVIGLDRQKVAAGLAAKFKELTPYLASRSSTKAPGAADSTDSLEFGFDYLEKFIQLPYHLPEPSTDGIQTFLHALNGKDSTPAGDQQPREYQLLVVELKSDGETVNRMASMVAPVFDNNPRRIKQFINMFRLRALLAGRTGLLSKDPGPSRMTLEQLAKLVAIELRWPTLLQDAERDTTLLANLQKIVWTKGDGAGEQSTFWLKRAANQTETYWIGQSKLMDLIAGGFEAVYGDPLSLENEQAARYGLHGVDLRCFLRVSPIVQVRPPAPADQSSRSQKASQPESMNSGRDFDLRKDRTERAPDAPQSSAETNVPRRGRTAGQGGTNPAQYAGWSEGVQRE
jgi:hypothetical protein